MSLTNNHNRAFGMEAGRTRFSIFGHMDLNYEVQAMLHSSARTTIVILKFFVMLGLGFLVDNSLVMAWIPFFCRGSIELSSQLPRDSMGHILLPLHDKA